MKILFRPVRGGLKEAMDEMKEFDTIEQMYEYITKMYADKDYGCPMSIDELSMKYYTYDERMDWETYLITTKRFFSDIYEYPQAIGYCAFKDDEGNNIKDEICIW